MRLCRVQDEAERTAKFKELIETTFADKAKLLEQALAAQPGPYLTGDAATYGDWHAFGYIGQFMAGLFGMPTDVWKQHAGIEQYRHMMASRDDVQRYFEEKGKEMGEEYMAMRRGFLP